MTETAKRPSRGKGSGRAARMKARQSDAGPKAIWPGVQGGAYKPLSDGEMEKVHQAALAILERTGLGDWTDELREICEPVGATINEQGRLCFPRALVEDALAKTPNEYLVHARGSRKGKDDIHCSKQSVYFCNSGTAVTTFQPETKTYRPSIAKDMYDFTRLVDQLDNISMTSDTVLATDHNDDFPHDMTMVYALMAASEKPTCFSFRQREHILPGIEIMDVAHGGEGKFLKEPSAIFGGCPVVSPLRFGEENLGVMIDTAKLGLTIDLAVAPQSGATAPATLAGILAQVTAETLACLTIVQIIHPGCAFTFAAWPFITDLRTGSFTGGSGEQALVAAAAIQMGNFYDLPCSVGCGMTDSKIPDAQFGYEKALAFTLAAHAGANRLCEAGGMMGSLMGCSFEAMVMDNEIMGMVLRTLRGIEVNDDTLSLDIIHEAVTGPGHFLGADQTLSVMETEYSYPELLDRSPTGQWEQEGQTDLYDRSSVKANEILGSHFPNFFNKIDDDKIRSKFDIGIKQSDMTAAG